MNDDLDLSAVAADAALLDALSAGTAPDPDALAGLAALRAALDEDLADLLATPAPALVPAGAAPVVLSLHRPSSRSRRSRRATVLLAGAALALSSTGVAAATYEARPGDVLYGLRTTVAGPRAEDPALLRERLDAVQERLDAVPATGAPARDAAAELAEVAALLSTLDPSQRGDLAQRLATLTEQLAASATARPGAAGETAGEGGTTPPAGPLQGVQSQPPTDTPATGGPERPRPDPTPAQGTTPPARPTSAPTAEPEPEPERETQAPPRATPEPGPPTADEPEPEQPAPRTTQDARPSQEPTQEPASPADRAGTPRAGSAADAATLLS